jgi:hypothetical protein
MTASGDSSKHYEKAVEQGLNVEPEIVPRLPYSLNDVWKAFNVMRYTGYQFCSNLPIGDIIQAYNVYYYDGTLVEFIDLIRACEKKINERDTNSNRNKG